MTLIIVIKQQMRLQTPCYTFVIEVKLKKKSSIIGTPNFYYYLQALLIRANIANLNFLGLVLIVNLFSLYEILVYKT